jgi:hypothetical protein
MLSIRILYSVVSYNDSFTIPTRDLFKCVRYSKWHLGDRDEILWLLRNFCDRLEELTPWCRVLFSKLIVAQLVRITLLLLDPKFRRIHKNPLIVPILTEMSLIHTLMSELFWIQFNISSHLRQVLTSGHFPLGFRPKLCTPSISYVSPTPFSLILSPYWYFSNNTYCEAPHYAFFPTSYYLHHKSNYSPPDLFTSDVSCK